MESTGPTIANNDSDIITVLVLGRQYRLQRSVLGRYSDLADVEVTSSAVVVIDLPEQLELGDIVIQSADALRTLIRVLDQYDPADHRRYRFQQIEAFCSPLPLWSVAAVARALHCDEVVDVCDAKSVRTEHHDEFGLETFRFALRHGLDHLRRRSVLSLIQMDWDLDIDIEHIADAFLNLNDDETDLRPLLSALVRLCTGTAQPITNAELVYRLEADPDFEIWFTQLPQLQYLRDVLHAGTAWPPALVQHANRLGQRFRVMGPLAGRYDANRALFEIMAQIADQATQLLVMTTTPDGPVRPAIRPAA